MPLDISPQMVKALVERVQSPPAIIAPRQPPQIGQLPYWMFLAGQGADLGTTLHFLSQGGHEANRLVGDSSRKAIAVKGAGIVASLVGMKLLDHIAQQRQRKLAAVLGKAIGYGGAGLGGWAALHNAFGIPGPPVVTN